MTSRKRCDAETLTAFVPNRVTAFFSRLGATSLKEPVAEPMEAALLFVDMSGFTPLTEGLSSQGDMGIEKLSHILNEYFGQITDAIAEHDGDVIKFAGDAVLVLFAVPAHPSRLPLDTGTDQPISDRMRIGAEETLADLVLRAAHCAMDLHSRFHRYTVGEAEKGIVLKLHSAISAGSVWGVHVGIRQRWEYLLKGDPLEQLGLAMHVAGHGEVALSPEAYNAVADRVTVDRALRLLSIELKHHPHYVRLASLGGAVTTDILPSSSPMLQTSVPNFAGVHEPPGTSLAVFKKHARARMTHSGETVQTLSSGYHTPVHSVVGHNFELPSLPSLPSLLSLASLPTVPANSSEKNKKNNVSGDGDDDGAETRGMYEVQGGGEGERKARTSGGNGSTSKQKKSIFKPGDGGVGDCDGGNGGLRVTLPTSTVSSVSTGTTPGSVNNRFISGLLTSSVHPDRDGPMHGDGVRAGSLSSLRRYLPQVLLPRLDAGQSQFLAEFRVVSVLFMLLPEHAFRGTEENVLASLKKLQAVTALIMEETVEHEGHVRQLLTDDKGTVMITVFGLKSSVDATRNGVHAALEIHRRMRTELGEAIAIGVTTGGVFCGSVGSRTRCEFTVMGDTVNKSARLMSKVAGGDGIICDDATQQACNDRGPKCRLAPLFFEHLAPLTLKGKARPVAVWRPSAHPESMNVWGDCSAPEIDESIVVLFRPSAVERVLRHLWRVQEHGDKGRQEAGRLPSVPSVPSVPSSSVLLTSSAGMGLSSLLAAVAVEAGQTRMGSTHTTPMTVFVAAGSRDSHEPYRAFRDVVARILDLMCEAGIVLPAAFVGRDALATSSGSDNSSGDISGGGDADGGVGENSDSATPDASDLFSDASHWEDIPRRFWRKLGLLNTLCPTRLHFPLSQEIISLRGHTRMEATTELVLEVVTLLRKRLFQYPLLVLDDCQRLDSGSEALLRGLAAQGTVPLLLGFQIPAPGCPLVSPLGFDQEPSALLRDLGPPEEGGQDHTGGDTGGVTVPPTFHRLRSVQPQRRTRMGTPARRARRVSLPSRRVQSVSKETPQIEYMCLHLDRLTPQEMQAFICTTMQADSVSEAVAELMETLTKGDPGLLHELVRSMTRQGACGVFDGGRLGLNMLADEVVGPMSVEEGIREQVDLLPPTELLVLQVCSAVGMVSSTRALFEVLQGVVSITAEDLAQHLEHLCSIKILRQNESVFSATGSALLPGLSGDFAFCNRLMREVVYKRLPFATRALFHSALAEWFDLAHQYHLLVEAAHEDFHVREVALHKAVKYFTRAAHLATTTGVTREAETLLQTALALHHETASAKEPPGLRSELQLLLKLGPALMASQGCWFPSVLTTYRRMLELSRQVPGAECELTAVIGVAKCLLSRFSSDAAEVEECTTACKESRRLALASPDEGQQIAAYTIAYISSLCAGRLDEALAMTGKVLDMYEHEQQFQTSFELVGQDPGAAAAATAASILALQGETQQATAMIETAVQHAKSHGHVTSMGDAYEAVLLACIVLEDDTLLHRVGLEDLTPLSHTEELHGPVHALMDLLAHAKSGDKSSDGHGDLIVVGTVSTLLSLEKLPHAKERWVTTMCLYLCCCIFFATGDFARGHDLCRQWALAITQRGSDLLSAECYRFYGCFLLMAAETLVSSPPDALVMARCQVLYHQATSLFAKSIREAERVGAKALLLRGHTWATRLLLSRGYSLAHGLEEVAEPMTMPFDMLRPTTVSNEELLFLKDGEELAFLDLPLSPTLLISVPKALVEHQEVLSRLLAEGGDTTSTGLIAGGHSNVDVAVATLVAVRKATATLSSPAQRAFLRQPSSRFSPRKREDSTGGSEDKDSFEI